MKKLILLFLLIIGQKSLAQDPYYISYSIEDGLPSSNIYSVFQEDNGIIWFTTDAGIVKYNSKSFELFNTEDGLSDNEVFKMRKDHKGRVWFLTLNGKPSFFYKGKIYNSKNSSLLKQITSSGFCLDIIEDKYNTIYLAYRSGEVYKIESSNKATLLNNHKNSLFGIWIYNNELYGLESESIYNFNKKKIYTTTSILPFRVYNTSTGTFVNTFNEVFKVKNEKLIPFITLNENVEIINIVKENNNQWICTRNGVFLYKNNVFIKKFFEGYVLTDVLKDFEGNYWFTSLNRGVLFVPSLEIRQILPDVKINTLAADKQSNLWIGGFENDYYVKDKNLKNHSLSFYYKDKISNIRFINDTTYIIGKAGFKIITPEKKEINIKLNVNDIVEKNNFYYTGTNYTARTKFSGYFKNFSEFHLKAILWKRTNVLEKDKNNIWIGTNFGLHYYNEKDSIVNLAEKYADLSISIEDLYYDKESNLLYVATASKGLVIIKNNKQFKKYSTTQNLNSNSVNSIKKINQNQFLIGSNNGLNEINFKTNKVISYNSLLGIENKKIKDVEFINDTIYLSTDNGVISFNRNSIIKRIDKPKCIINSILSDNKIASNNIEYNKNNISITYTGISFKDKGNVNYFYKLEPQDKDWYTTKEAQVNFKSLPAGKFVFKVYCENGNRIKSKIQTISFEISPPFWQKLWFKLLLFGLLTALVFIFIKLQLKKEKKKFEIENKKIQIERDKAQLEKNIIELEQKALRLQMNPHFIFNALNTIKGYYTEGNDIKASRYISKFSKLLRKLLENEDQITSLENEIEMLKLYIDLAKIRYQDKFDYSIEIKDNINSNEVAIPNLLLQPIVENAIIHGLAPKDQQGMLVIDFSSENNKLICVVEDNGIGRKASEKIQKNKQHESKATEIIADRLKLFDKETTIQYIDLEQNNKATGTKVIITIPIKTIW